MALLVSDLLDLARQDSGRLHLQCRPLLADDILLPLYERLGPRAGGRLQLQLADEAAAPLPLGLADPERLQQCLTALAENALAYAPAHRKTVSPGRAPVYVADQLGEVREPGRPGTIYCRPADLRPGQPIRAFGVDFDEAEFPAPVPPTS